MKNPTDVNEFLENLENLDIDDQTYILEVLSKRLIDQKRLGIAKRAREAGRAYERGATKSGNIEDLWKDLND